MTTTNDTRKAFLDFFGKNGHAVLPSSPLVPHNDPTLMFTNAGMNQFKNIFTGAEKAKSPRAATSQKCVRAGGKHNDLDNVGYTARHHTFFEMLGNFSFGDYFKEGAIEFAWNLLTKEMGLDKSKLTFTVYHTDDEAFNLWKKITGCEDGRILRIPTKDNFWAMGDTGPCGPCSEIFYDHGEKAGNGEWALNPNGTDRFDARFVEIWNLVFMQYEQVTPEERINLPKPSIDTGMGLERIAAVMQGVHDNYDIDLFKRLIQASEALTKTKATGENKAAHRVIADHLRSSCFLIADGVLPSNEGRGYVLRRIMRRAMRYAHQLGCKEPLMYRLVPSLVKEMGGAYPELTRAQAAITENLQLEEERFKQTLERGLKLLDEETAGLKKGGTLTGEVAFKLYDTYGFPLDLTEDILRGRGMAVDNAGFEKAMQSQKEMARAAWSGSGEKTTDKLWFSLRETLGPVEFLGYAADEAKAKIIALMQNGESVEQASAGDAVIITNATPFYGESGGQVGDSGWISSSRAASESAAIQSSKDRVVSSPQAPRNDDLLATVTDTLKPFDDFIVHKAMLKAPLKVGDKVTLSVDSARRNHTRANHSATHILHAALRKQLGEHITQKGSLVSPDRLRFDISHPKAVSREELDRIEQEVNRIIAQNAATCTEVLSPDEAQKKGAMALFGEKYGDRVRVVSMGIKDNHRGGNSDPYSMELCGGTHVKRTGDIGAFKLVSEGSVASGVRRVEAITGEGVREYALKELAKLQEQAQGLAQEHAQLLLALKKPAAPAIPPISLKAIEEASLPDVIALYDAESKRAQAIILSLQEENKKLSKQLADVKMQRLLTGAGQDTKPETIGNVAFIAKSFDDVAPKDLRPLAENFLKQTNNGIVVVATGFEGKASIVAAVSKPLHEQLSAVELVQAAAAATGGKGGGGRPDMAQAGGPDASKLPEAIAAMRNIVREKCG